MLTFYCHGEIDNKKEKKKKVFLLRGKGKSFKIGPAPQQSADCCATATSYWLPKGLLGLSTIFPSSFLHCFDVLFTPVGLEKLAALFAHFI